MKIVFNDSTELQIQQASIVNGQLKIKTIAVRQEELKLIFSDEFRIQKMTVVEREQIVTVYEKYTSFGGITSYVGGMLEVFLDKKGESTEEKMEKLHQENAELKEHIEFLTSCVVEMSEVVYE